MSQPAPSQLDRAVIALNRARERIAALERARSEPIAIIGLGCRFPGGGTGPEGFWHLLRDGVDAVREIPPDRWARDPLLQATGVRRASLLDEVDGFDAAFFGIAPREAISLDPQQRLLLEVAWETLEHGGQAPERLMGSRTGVFTGVMNQDYYRRATFREPGQMDLYSLMGNSACFVAGRLSYVYGFQGPCVALDTACSSSLVAVHLACASLRAGESDLALAGGVNLILSQAGMFLIAQTQGLAPDGRCKTFDARANGIVRAEGCGMVLLKRLADALRDGDRIWAVIRGSAINHDGRSASITAPNMLAQRAVLRQALADARVSPEQVGCVEAHGTGTVLGDPIEVEALKEVLGKPRPDGSTCALGSVKTNLGHLEAAAGIAGLLKMVLALHHGSIPRHLHFQKLNPMISLEGTPFVIPAEPMEWRAGAAPRIAGVSSFGLSGTNAHVVLEEAPRTLRAESPARAPARLAGPVVLPLSARTGPALQQLAGRYRALLSDPAALPGVELYDLAHTAGARRNHFEHRLAVTGRTREALREGLEAFLEGRPAPGVFQGEVRPSGPPRVAFVFPGQGAQWVGMGQELLASEPAFAAALRACDQALRPHTGWSLLEELQAPESTSRMSRIDVVQPLLFGMSVSLAALWRSWGVQPDAVVGHSLGEICAACVSGALSLEDAARACALRSKLLLRVAGQGAMALVELPWREVERRLAGDERRACVGVINSPRTTVISGEVDAVGALVARFESEGVFCRRINADVASHSPKMDPLREDLLAALAGVSPRAGSVPLYSTVDVAALDGSTLDAAYWVRNLREPVRFSAAVEKLLADGYSAFVELSPNPILLPALEQQEAASGERCAVASLRRKQGERAQLLESLGALYARGVPVDWRSPYEGGAVVALPAYPFQHQRYWLPPVAEYGGGRVREGTGAAHPLLGRCLVPADRPGAYLWESTLDLREAPFLGDHRVGEAPIFPGAGYLELALAAAREALGERAFELEGAAFHQALPLIEGRPVALQALLAPEGPGRWSFLLFARDEPAPGPPGWVRHASVGLRAVADGDAGPPEVAPPDDVRARCREELSGEAHYRALARYGLGYGPAFQGVERLWVGDAEALGQVRRPESPAGGYVLHPAALDAALQVAAALVARRAGEDREPALPVGVERLRVFHLPETSLFSHARLRAEDARERGALVADVLLFDASGRLCVQVEGLRIRRAPGGKAGTSAEDGDFVAVRWEPAAPAPEPAPAPSASKEGDWLLVADEDVPVARALQALLEARGERATRVDAGALEGRGARPCRGVVFLGALGKDQGPAALDAAPEALARASEGALRVVQALAKAGSREVPRLWLVTRGAQEAGVGAAAPVDVAQAALWGLGRTVAYEHPDLLAARIDLDPARPAGEGEALLRELLGGGEEEVALRGGARFAGRLVRRPPEPRPREQQVPAGDRPFSLEIDEPGILERLTARAAERRPPGPGEVEVQVRVAGLNFVDVMKALGVYPDLPPGPVWLGGECAGTVVAVGGGVEGLAEGQEVIAFAPRCFARYVTAPASFVVPLPAGLSAAQGATLPVAFTTAWYALHHLARLQPGERVLIHSAASGTGLAAVKLAQRAGAVVLATAGSPEKRDFLRGLGIAHVMDSRAPGWSREVLAATSGEGVDVVLNSLSGGGIEESLSALARDGRFLELGKRDLFEAHRTLRLEFFRKRISFHAVDLLGVAAQRPARFAALLREVIGAAGRGEIEPLPVQRFPFSQAQAAFWTMAQGRHAGKLALSLEDPEVRISVPAGEPPRIRPDGAYLVTGGLGGVGLMTARWLVEQGARHLVLCGRGGAATPAQVEAVQALRAGGAEVAVEPVDVADRERLAALLGSVERRLPPLRGVFHSAGVLDDGLLAQQDAERLRRVLAPKALGALHLHQLTRHLPLELFVLYSSAASLFGSPGQGTYAAANACLDALALHRRALGLPALSVSWGSIGEVGLAAASEDRGARLERRGFRPMKPAEAMALLGRVLASREAHLGIVPVDVHQWFEFNPQVAASPRLAPLAAGAARPRGAGQRAAAIRSAPPGERRSRMEELVREQVGHVLRLPPADVAREAPLRALGVDSLMGLELRNRLERELDRPLPATLIWTYPDVARLSEHLLHAIGGMPPGGAEAASPTAGAAEAEAAAERAAEAEARERLASLSDEALAALVTGASGDSGE